MSKREKQIKRSSDRQAGFSLATVLSGVGALLVIGLVALAVYHHQHHAMDSAASAGTLPNKTQGTSSGAQTQSTLDPYQGWNTYTSSLEKASFKYPTNWATTSAVLSPSDSGADSVGVKSPSGAITISWISDISGFGNEASTSYPLNTVLDKTAISAAPGYYLVSGITTLDGTTYYPWIAVQDTNGILASGVQGDLATFIGKHNINPSTKRVTGILFATCGARTVQNSPALSQSQATSWFSGSEAQQAKEILLSFSDQN